MKEESQYHEINESAFFRLTSPHKLAEQLGLSLDALRELCAHGDRNFKQFSMGKDEKERWIETPKDALKKVQRQIHVLLSRIEPPTYLFSAYRGKSSVKNANHHIENARKPMVKLDVRRFYPSAHGKRVYELFYNVFQCASDVAGMLTTLCTIGVTQNSSWRHLPTGGTTSPILAFLAYREMFAEIFSVAEREGLILSVMADDITLSGDKADSEILTEIQSIIARYGLRSNFLKSKIWPANHNHKLVTGVVLTPQGMRVPWKQKQKIQSLRAEIDATTEATKRAKLFQRLVGSLSSAGQIESRYHKAANFVMNEWKGDLDAWSIHRNESMKRHAIKRKATI